MLSIINKSIAKLEKTLTDSELDMVYDMMRIAHKKVFIKDNQHLAFQKL